MQQPNALNAGAIHHLQTLVSTQMIGKTAVELVPRLAESLRLLNVRMVVSCRVIQRAVLQWLYRPCSTFSYRCMQRDMSKLFAKLSTRGVF